MNLKDPEKEFFNDFEHKVTDKMKKYADRVDFPKVEDYGITRMELDDYLFDKQAILDMAGTPRTKMTVGGIITLLPVIVLSAFPDSAYIYGKMWTTVPRHRRRLHALHVHLRSSEGDHPAKAEQAQGREVRVFHQGGAIL